MIKLQFWDYSFFHFFILKNRCRFLNFSLGGVWQKKRIQQSYQIFFMKYQIRQGIFRNILAFLWSAVTGSLFWKLKEKSSLRNRRDKKSWNEKIFLLPPFSTLWISLYYSKKEIYLWLLCVKYKNSKCRRHQIITSRETRPLRFWSQNIHGRANIDVSWRSAKMLFLLTIRLLWKSPTHGNLQT